MKTPDILKAIQPVISMFEELSIPYYIGGSIASSIYGMDRATLDVDVIADIKMGHVSPLRKQLEEEFYIDEEVIKDAIKKLSSFNLIHLETMIKIDVFIHKPELYAEETILRRRKDTIEDSKGSLEFYFSSPEDIILNKLQWYDDGGRVSERQWLDVIGVIKVQGGNLDRDYLRKWGRKLKLFDLLKKAFFECGVDI